MAYETIKVSLDQPVAKLVLNRPDQRNSINGAMIKEVTEVLGTINRIPEIRSVIVTGNGAAFCSGMDLEYLRSSIQKTHEENLEDARNLHKLLRTLHQLKKISIAVVNGPAMGGGCGLAAACDYVFIGAQKGKMGVPEVRIGFVPAIILYYLIKRMGSSSAREFVLQGGVMDATTAVGAGLASGAYDDSALMEEAEAFALTLASQTSPSSIGLTKELLSRFDEMDIASVQDYANQLNAIIRKSDDFRKGIESFLTKENLKW